MDYLTSSYHRKNRDLNGNSACLQNRRYFFKTEVKATKSLMFTFAYPSIYCSCFLFYG